MAHGCLKLDNQVEMFIDDSSYGRSDYMSILEVLMISSGFANKHFR